MADDGSGKENQGKKTAHIRGAERRKTLKNLLLLSLDSFESKVVSSDIQSGKKWREGKPADETPPN